jgi:hypothetical protein
LDWDGLLERSDADIPAQALLERYVAAHGRKGLQTKVEQVLAPYGGRFAWDSPDRCFRPVGDTPPNQAARPTACAVGKQVKATGALGARRG